MKIGFITGEYPPMEGGVGAFTQELARAMADLGHEIHIITDKAARPPNAPAKLRTLHEPIDIGFAKLHPRIKKWRHASVSTIVDIIMRQELDVVNIQYQAAAYDMRSPAINLLPWRLKGVVKTVVTFHDLRVPYLFPKAGRLREAAVSFMARRSHGVIVTNHADYQSLFPNLESPISQIPIGSNIETYSPNHIEIREVRDKLGLSEADCLLGYFGFLNDSKGAETLLHALAELDPRYHLLFIGGQTGASDATNNAYLEHIKTMVAELSLAQRVHWTGFLSDVRVSAHLHAADMMVMPYKDGVSLRRGTLMAALAHKRPLISTRATVPTPELQHGQNIWLVPADNPQALSQAITTLAADSALREKLAAAAEQLAQNFTWDKIAVQTLEFLNAVPFSRPL